MTVVTPVAVILKAFFDSFRVVVPQLVCVFDSTLTFSESVSSLRSLRSMLKIKDGQVFPFLTWNRGQILPNESIGRGHSPIRSRPSDPSHADIFQSRHCTFAFNFVFYTDNVVSQDSFEVLYNCRSHFNKVINAVVQLPHIGDFEYQIVWDSLNSFEVSQADCRYFATGGSAVIHGAMISMLDVPAALITYIDAAVAKVYGAIETESLSNLVLIG